VGLIRRLTDPGCRMFASLYDYIVTFFLEWIWILTSGPYAIERILWQIWPGYRVWISRVWSDQTSRRRITAALFFGGIFLSGFLAFNDERTLLIQANTTIGALKVPDVPGADADSVKALGSTRATATAVSARYNLVESATPGGGVVLKPVGHRPITVKNATSVDILVYPPPGAQFTDQKIDEPMRLQWPVEDTFVCITETKCSS
jgi:hypothetical protein